MGPLHWDCGVLTTREDLWPQFLILVSWQVRCFILIFGHLQKFPFVFNFLHFKYNTCRFCCFLFVCLILLDALSLLLGTVICYLSLTLENSWYYFLFFWYSNYTCYTISCGLTAHSSWMLCSFFTSCLSLGNFFRPIFKFTDSFLNCVKSTNKISSFLLLVFTSSTSFTFYLSADITQIFMHVVSFSFKPFNILDTVIANALFDNFNI